MRLLQRRIQDAAKRTGVNQLVVERDYAQSYVLLGIASHPVLYDTLVFKGGTALKKVYFDDYRFSEDLDFSSVGAPAGVDLEHAVVAAVDTAQAAARELAPFTMLVERYQERDPHPGGQEAFVVRVQFPWQRQPVVPIKIEVTHDELVLLPTPAMPVLHGYSEPMQAAVHTYSLEEVSAEKLRSIRQTQAKLMARGWARPRARDFFDLWHLLRLDARRLDWTQVARLLAPKCAHRQVAIGSIAELFEPALLDEVRASWNRTLGPFVPELPSVEQVFAELRVRLEKVLAFPSR
jgi:predicted nucleotidyltransferase component of viral defense system